MDERTAVPGAGGLASGGHQLTVTNRRQALVSGVTQVASFDDREIILDTRSGSLIIRGENLHITQLDLDSGRFSVDGTVNTLQYGPSLRDRDGGRVRGRGLFERLLK